MFYPHQTIAGHGGLDHIFLLQNWLDEELKTIVSYSRVLSSLKSNSQSPHLASSCIVEFDSISRHCTSEARYACIALGWNELNLLNLHSQDDSDGALNYFAQTRRSTFNLACWFLFKLVTYFILRALMLPSLAPRTKSGARPPTESIFFSHPWWNHRIYPLKSNIERTSHFNILFICLCFEWLRDFTNLSHCQPCPQPAPHHFSMPSRHVQLVHPSLVTLTLTQTKEQAEWHSLVHYIVFPSCL